MHTLCSLASLGQSKNPPLKFKESASTNPLLEQILKAIREEEEKKKNKKKTNTSASTSSDAPAVAEDNYDSDDLFSVLGLSDHDDDERKSDSDDDLFSDDLFSEPFMTFPN